MDLNELPQTPFRRHPWEVARARFFARLLDETFAGGLGHGCRVLDVGAGDGFVARALLDRLPSGSEVTCVDANYTDADLTRLTEPPRARLSFTRERPPGRFDLVLLLDVIEHVPDDRAFLDEIVTHAVAPAGHVLVSVPAWQALYTGHDVALKHFRRYSPADCRRVLNAVGLIPVRSGGLFHSLLLPRALSRVLEAVRPGGVSRPANLGEWRHGRALTATVGAALAADVAASRLFARAGLQIPGLSYWALCRAGGT